MVTVLCCSRAGLPADVDEKTNYHRGHNSNTFTLNYIGVMVICEGSACVCIGNMKRTYRKSLCPWIFVVCYFGCMFACLLSCLLACSFVCLFVSLWFGCIKWGEQFPYSRASFMNIHIQILTESLLSSCVWSNVTELYACNAPLVLLESTRQQQRNSKKQTNKKISFT